MLRIDRVAHLDHAVAQAIDVFLVGARVAELLDARIGDLQRAQAAVVVKRNRVINAQSQDGLGLHVDAGLVGAGFDEGLAGYYFEANGDVLLVADPEDPELRGAWIFELLDGSEDGQEGVSAACAFLPM